MQPSRWVFSIGWWADEKGDPVQWLIDVDAAQPPPSELTTEAGMVVYRLRRWDYATPPQGNAPQPIDYDVIPGGVQGLVAVQVNADGTMAIELRPGVQDPATLKNFSDAKRLYRR